MSSVSSTSRSSNPASSNPSSGDDPNIASERSGPKLGDLELPLNEFINQRAKGGARTKTPAPDPHIEEIEKLKGNLSSAQEELAKSNKELAAKGQELSAQSDEIGRLSKLLPPSETEIDTARNKYRGAIDRSTAGKNPREVAENLHEVATALYVTNERIRRGEEVNKPITKENLDQLRDYVGGIPDAKGKEERAVDINLNVVARQLATLERHGIDADKLESFMKSAANEPEKKGGFWSRARGVAEVAAGGPAGAAIKIAERAKRDEDAGAEAQAEGGLRPDFIVNPLSK